MRAVILLAEAARFARDSGHSRWSFAVTIQRLIALGLREIDLQLLVRMRFVRYACEVDLVGGSGRHFQRTGELCFTDRTCFVLTDLGIAISQRLLASNERAGVPGKVESAAKIAMARLAVPIWDAGRRTLTIDGAVLKQFKRPAGNQETILSVFHEEGWPVRIDDPLPPIEAVDSKQRLNNAIKSLNRNQRQHAILFRGDGTGQGIVWELCQ